MATKTVTNRVLNPEELHLSINVNHELYFTLLKDSESPGGPANLDDVEADSPDAPIGSRLEGIGGQASRCHKSLSRSNSGTSALSPFLHSEDLQSDRPPFEGDKNSQAYFRRMLQAPEFARHRLLLAVEPRKMLPRHRWILADPDSLDSESCRGPPPLMMDFCVPFSRELLQKLKVNRELLQLIADRTCSLIYIRKTLLLREFSRTKTWAKYLMCRIFCFKEPLLNRCFHLLEQFDVAFQTRHSCQQDRPRVTLVPNQSVPENTALQLRRQRLGKYSNYFDKMPLLPGQHLSSLAARLSSKCLNERSLLAQLVVIEN